MINIRDSSLHHFDTMPGCDGRTDLQTDKRPAHG